ncbi:hypothetical protein EJ04DRAFT_254042 [Polyplosphaeria fusca]|uniref:Uncharacterized protein n=1 Tax=Polyplosphaeria fusca TaxID=682080 RepID=A0A9P4V287_9PLEO|nr:hypothetical protein EJ04DRAFT_254042 [Polyplosphaeria fusca]
MSHSPCATAHLPKHEIPNTIPITQTPTPRSSNLHMSVPTHNPQPAQPPPRHTSHKKGSQPRRPVPPPIHQPHKHATRSLGSVSGSRPHHRDGGDDARHRRKSGPPSNCHNNRPGVHTYASQNKWADVGDRRVRVRMKAVSLCMYSRTQHSTDGRMYEQVGKQGRAAQRCAGYSTKGRPSRGCMVVT